MERDSVTIVKDRFQVQGALNGLHTHRNVCNRQTNVSMGGRLFLLDVGH